MPVPHRLLSVPSLLSVQALLVAVLPHGGQQTARRNAWSAMVSDAGRARARREAAVAVAAAHSAHAARAEVAARTAR